MNIKIKHFFYLSNILSISRVLLIFPIVFLIKSNGGSTNTLLIVLGIIIIATDYFDGFFSRKFGQVTDLGKILDPIADKVAMASILFALVYYMNFPLVLVLALIYRDMLIILLGILVNKKLEKPIMANFWGKLNTTVFSIAALLFIMNLRNFIFTFFYFLSYLVLIISAISYYKIGETILFRKKSIRYLFRIFMSIITIIYFIIVPNFFEKTNNKYFINSEEVNLPNKISLLKKFSPILFFTRGEKYLPIQVESFFDNAKLMKWQWFFFDNEIEERINYVSLMKYNSDRYYLKLNRNVLNDIFKLYSKVKHKYRTTVYCNIRKFINEKGLENYALQYWFFFWASELPNLFITWHECDWEMVMYILDENYEPILAGYSQHFYGEVKNWGEIQKVSGHPVVYIAQGSHACYYGAGKQFTYLTNKKTIMLGSDYSSADIVFYPKDYVLEIIDDSTKWNNFKGYWGLPLTTKLPGPKYRYPNDKTIAMWLNPFGWIERFSKRK